MFFVKCMFFFLDVFINHFAKIHRSFLSKITIDLLYFWDVFDFNLWEKVTCPVRWPNRHFSEILLAHRHTLVTQNCQTTVRLHHCPLSNQITWFFDHQYHWKKTRNILDFFHKHRCQRNIASKTTAAWLWPSVLSHT